MVVEKWLEALRTVPEGKIAEFELGQATVTSEERANLPAFLRSCRACRTLSCAKVPASAERLSWLDLVACLAADVVVADSTKDSCPINCAVSENGTNGKCSDAMLPAEEVVVRSLWAEASGVASPQDATLPTTLLDLRKTQLISTEEELESIRASGCRTPQFLLGFRRAGGLRGRGVDKGGVNYYWVTKVILLNALTPDKDVTKVFMPGSTEDSVIPPYFEAFNAEKQEMRRPSVELVGAFAPPNRDDPASPAHSPSRPSTRPIVVDFVEATGLLKLLLRADILDLEWDKIQSKLGSWVKDRRVSRIQITLPGDDPSAIRRIVPGESAEKKTAAYKWYRKWDHFIGLLLEHAPVQCELQGPTIPALLELFFSSAVRIWSWKDAKVGFNCAGFLPGAAFFRAHLGLPRKALQRLLLQGIPLDEAASLGIVCGPDGKAGVSEPACSLPTISPILSLLQEKYAQKTPPNAELVKGLPVLADLVGFALSLPGNQHDLTQSQVCTRLGLKDKPLGALFKADHIQNRSLAQIGELGFGFHAPDKEANDKGVPGQGVLTHKHLRWARVMLAEAVKAACKDANKPLSEVGYVSVCSSSGFLLPGLSAYLVSDLQLRSSTARCDIVGMGCHAGLNSLQAAANWAAVHPGKVAVSCGVEVLSAAYMWADFSDMDPKLQLNHALCNSLFADGCFAAVLCKPTPSNELPYYARIHEFVSLIAPAAMHTMTYQWDDAASQFWFLLSEEAPYAVGAALRQLLHHQQDRGELPLEQVAHYVMHTGGQTVIDSAAAALGLDATELDPTRRALRKYGNNSSVSFMFAYSEFLDSSPCPVAEGDLGVFITMGPGAGFELGLWSAGARSASTTEAALRKPMICKVEDPPWEAGEAGSSEVNEWARPWYVAAHAAHLDAVEREANAQKPRERMTTTLPGA